MQRTPVTSSSLASVGYDAEQRFLEIEFTSGAVYQYRNVPEAVYRGLINAVSHGGYFADHIKDVGYSVQRIV